MAVYGAGVWKDVLGVVCLDEALSRCVCRGDRDYNVWISFKGCYISSKG